MTKIIHVEVQGATPFFHARHGWGEWDPHLGVWIRRTVCGLEVHVTGEGDYLGEGEAPGLVTDAQLATCPHCRDRLRRRAAA